MLKRVRGLRTFSTITTKNIGYDMQKGARRTMEDFVIVDNNFNGYGLFGIFDGHGGNGTSKFIADNLKSYLLQNINKYQTNINQIFENTMKEIDDEITKNPENKLYFMGSTALIAMFNPNQNKFIISNVGDSRFLSIDKNNKITQITTDHHPKYHEIEKDRLIKMGELKQDFKFIPRYFGNGPNGIAMTRCIGNGYLKQYDPLLFLNVPDIIQYQLSENDKYLILCSDGLYENLEGFKSMWFQHGLHNFDKTPMELAQKLTQTAIYDDVTGDNVSVIVIFL